jgi:hypothetical protein
MHRRNIVLDVLLLLGFVRLYSANAVIVKEKSSNGGITTVSSSATPPN